MRVFATGINTQICHLLAAECTTRQHALDGGSHDPIGKFSLKYLASGTLLNAARMAGMPIINLVGPLLAGQLDFIGVDDDNIVAHIHMRGKSRLVLAAQAHCDDRRQTAQNDAFGINQEPLFVDISRFCCVGFHYLTILAVSAAP